VSDEQQEDFSEKTVPLESQLQSKVLKNIPEYEEVQPIETQPFIQRPEQDLQLFLNSLLGHLIPESLDVHKQSFIAEAKSIDESTSNIYSSDHISTIDKQQERTSVDIHAATFQQLQLTNTTDELVSSDSLTEVARQILAISRITKEDEKSSTDSAFKNISTTQEENVREDIRYVHPYL
jgi:hypothetical protein